MSEKIMKYKAYFSIILAATLWGLIGIFVKTLTARGFGVMETRGV